MMAEERYFSQRDRLSSSEVRRFRKIVYDYYRTHRRVFPWRRTRDPYHIVVSEIMLQQTQTDRVMQKYPQFIEAFPTFEALARAKFGKVLRVWQGMGYNRRAKALHGIAQMVISEYGGKLPRAVDKLKTLPGIGYATASSIAAFAFNKPTVFLETNIRSVFIHCFFDDGVEVHDDELMPLVEQTLDRKNPRQWYNALMDYGAMIKRERGNVSRRSKHYVKQSPFEGSNRQVRSMIIKTLLAHPSSTPHQVSKMISKPLDAVKLNLEQLVHEGMVVVQHSRFTIA